MAVEKLIILSKCIRVPNWRAYMGLALLGFTYACKTSFFFKLNSLFLLLVLMSAYLAVVFAVNNVFDVESDILNERKIRVNPLARGELGKREVLLFTALVAGLAVIVSSLYLKPEALLNYLLMFFLGIAYSAPPFRFKERPGLDLISHALFFGIQPFLFGALVAGELEPSASLLLVLLLIALYSVFLELRNELEDYASDLAAGHTTTVVKLGFKRGILLVVIIYWMYAAVAVAFMFVVLHSLILKILSLPSLAVALTLMLKGPLRAARLADIHAIAFLLSLSLL